MLKSINRNEHKVFAKVAKKSHQLEFNQAVSFLLYAQRSVL
jgi:hypothetical protein